MSNYQDVLKRLVAYRKQMGLTQEQVAREINLSQVQYSYLENGITKMTDKNLRALLESGWNIDHIITGVSFEYRAAELDGLFGGLKEAGEKKFVSKLLMEVMAERAARAGLAKKDKSAKRKIELLKAAAGAWEGFSMSYFVRGQLGLSQMVMAEKIGVGIKKYREIERELRYPDAEMLLSFYDMSGYQPALFMDYYDRRMLIIKMAWELFREEEKKIMLEFVRYLKTVI